MMIGILIKLEQRHTGRAPWEGTWGGDAIHMLLPSAPSSQPTEEPTLPL
jgi:hypothetical protein